LRLAKPFPQKRSCKRDPAPLHKRTGVISMKKYSIKVRLHPVLVNACRTDKPQEGNRGNKFTMRLMGGPLAAGFWQAGGRGRRVRKGESDTGQSVAWQASNRPDHIPCSAHRAAV